MLSVVICAFNPNIVILKETLDCLKNQTLSLIKWELIIVDNASTISISTQIDLSWHPNSKIVEEKNPGLIHARIKGTAEAKYDYIVSVDDDTFLRSDYLNNALNIFNTYPEMGIFGGRSKAEFEVTPPNWVHSCDGILCIKDLGEEVIITQRKNEEELFFPSNGPFLIAYRKSAFENVFLKHFLSNKVSKNLGRKGKSLASGEDNDITLSIFREGYQIGYFPELLFTHYIPAFRIQLKYLSNLVYASTKTWVVLLDLYGINPWKPISKYTVTIRKMRAYFRLKAWQNERNLLNWKGACGKFDGLDMINNIS